MSLSGKGAPPAAPGRPPFLGGPGPFVFHYVREWPWRFAGLITMVLGAASCAIAVQYVMKLLVDAMAGPDGGPPRGARSPSSSA